MTEEKMWQKVKRVMDCRKTDVNMLRCKKPECHCSIRSVCESVMVKVARFRKKEKKSLL